MKLAFFDPATGQPARIFSGREVDASAARADPRYDGFEVRELDGGPFEGVMSLSALPTLADFDATAPLDGEA